MNNRPAFDPAIWSSNENINDVGQPWHGEPTKVRPGAGKIATGFVPNEPIAGDYVNWALNDVNARVAALDLIDVSNWTEVSTITSPPGTIVTGAAAMTWHEGSRILLAWDDDIVQSSEDGGYTWITETTLPSSLYRSKDVATRDGTLADPTDGATAIVYDTSASGSPGTAEVRIQGPLTAGAWTTRALVGLPGVESVSRIKPDIYRGGFWAVGLANTGRAGVWRIPDFKGGVTLAQIFCLSLTGTDLLGHVALGVSTAIAAELSTGTRWFSFDPNATGTGRITFMNGPDAFMRTADLVHDDAHACFVAIMDLVGGPTGLRIWRSTSGLDGSWVDMTPSWGSLYDPIHRSACARGSVITFIVERIADGVRFIALSTNGGVTWRLLPDPFGRLWATVTPDPKSTMMRIIDRRAISFASTASGTQPMIQSLRSG